MGVAKQFKDTPSSPWRRLPGRAKQDLEGAIKYPNRLPGF